MLPLALCAIAKDASASDVLAAGRRLAATGAFRTTYVHVAAPHVPAAAYGHTPGAAAATTLLERGPAGAQRDAWRAGAELLRSVGVAFDEEAMVLVGDPADQLDRAAGGQDAALVVVGSHGRGPFVGALLGSVSQRLARTCARPVLIARGETLPGGGGPIVCGVQDDGECSRRAAVTAASLARALDSPLVLIHVAQSEAVISAFGPVVAIPASEEGARRRRHERLLRVTATHIGAPDAERLVVYGRPAEELDRIARGRRADMLVVGCHRRRVLSAIVRDAVSVDLGRRAGRPLVVVPPACAQAED
jgi:nucleotide-binding universal stress UspA family protein